MMTRAVTPQALGYIGIRAKALDDWASYGAGDATQQASHAMPRHAAAA